MRKHGVGNIGNQGKNRIQDEYQYSMSDPKDGRIEVDQEKIHHAYDQNHAQIHNKFGNMRSIHLIKRRNTHTCSNGHDIGRKKASEKGNANLLQ